MLSLKSRTIRYTIYSWLEESRLDIEIIEELQA